MSHFAEIENGIVKRVIVAEQEFIDSGLVGDPANWIQTSYNSATRKNFAGVGFTYDPILDAFIPPKSHESFVLDKEKCQWIPPTPSPDDGIKLHTYDVGKSKWVQIAQKENDGTIIRVTEK